MIVTGFYVRPQTMGIKKARKLQLFCAGAYMAMTAAPAYADSGAIAKAAAATFGASGPGLVIVQLLLIACVGWLSGYIAQAVGQSQIASMIKITTVFSCISLVAGTAFKAINTVAKFLG